MENSKKSYAHKSKTFVGVLILTLLMSTFSINFDYSEFVQRKTLNIPQWYSLIMVVVDVAIIASLIGIYFYKKMGVYVFPVAVFAHFLLHNIFFNSFLYFDIFLLFLYTLILVGVYPRWKFFK